MTILIRLLLLAGILCLSMHLVGGVVSYYSTLHNLSADPDASVDALAARANQLQQNPWPTFGWLLAGGALVASALGLMLLRWTRVRMRRRQAL